MLCLCRCRWRHKRDNNNNFIHVWPNGEWTTIIMGIIVRGLDRIQTKKKFLHCEPYGLVDFFHYCVCIKQKHQEKANNNDKNHTQRARNSSTLIQSKQYCCVVCVCTWNIIDRKRRTIGKPLDDDDDYKVCDWFNGVQHTHTHTKEREKFINEKHACVCVWNVVCNSKICACLFHFIPFFSERDIVHDETTNPLEMKPFSIIIIFFVFMSFLFQW